MKKSPVSTLSSCLYLLITFITFKISHMLIHNEEIKWRVYIIQLVDSFIYLACNQLVVLQTTPIVKNYMCLLWLVMN